MPGAAQERLILHAPMAGWMGDLSEVPDPVFAERMMGDGVAIDPTEGRLVAPCDGTVVLVPATAHSVTVMSPEGVELLMHVGLETVALAGAGFTAHVANGDAVQRGDPLLSFDMDLVLARAKSLLTPVILTNGDRFALDTPAPGRLLAAGDVIGEVRPLRAGAEPVSGGDGERRAEFVLQLPHGIHARPAARIAARAKMFAAEIVVNARGERANARSPVALMTLGAAFGDVIAISARGGDAADAIAAIIESMTRDLERVEKSAESLPPAPAAAPLNDAAAQEGFRGVCAVPGLAIGPAVSIRARDRDVAPAGAGAAVERDALAAAVASVAQSLGRSAASSDRTQAAVAEAHLALLEDVELLAAADGRIDAGRSAGFAWRETLRGYGRDLRATGNPLLAERADDLLDLERRVLTALAGDAGDPIAGFPDGAILLADDLLPSQLMELDLGRLGGVCTAGGGPTSHAAIMAAAAGVPMLVAVGPGVMRIADGAPVLLDATSGRLVADPADDARHAAEQAIAAATARRRIAQAAAAEDCRTLDGTRIELFANLGSLHDAAHAVAQGAEGCGLLRTEFLFADRQVAPDEAEQRGAYQAIADALDGGRPLIVRTLDIGGDKPVPYLPLPPEDNPALGLRGVRTSLWRPDLLDAQLAAVLGVRPAGRCRIMLPMVASLHEIRAVRARLDAIAGDRGFAHRVSLGIMIETPAAAITADRLAAEADFFSIGTNDLTQYALAMDRTNPLVAGQVDSFHPAVLRLIAAAARGAAAHGRPVGTCGGLASDPAGALLLIGLGVTELSATPALIPEIKARIRQVTLDRCRTLATRALNADSPDAVRLLIHDHLAPSNIQGAA